MKILYIANELADQAKTAAQVRVRALLPALHANAELRVIAFPPQGVPISEASAAGIDAVEFVERRQMGLDALVRATFGRNPRAFRRFDTPKTRAALSRCLSEFRPDIVHFDGFATLGLLDFVAEKSPLCARVAHIHDAQSARLKPFARYGSVAARLQYSIEYKKALAFETNGLARANLVLVDSSEDRDYLRSVAGCNHVHILPLGFDPKVFTPTGEKASLQQPAIVCSGSMSGKQSIDSALFLAREVMPLLWKEYSDAHLYIVGGGPTAEVKALEDTKVHITGFVDDLAAYLRAAAVYACALRLGSGMRTRVVEALACGAKTVATPMSIRGLDTDTTPWVIAESATEFAAEIAALLQGVQPDLGKNAAAFASQAYSWDKVAEQLITLYRGIAEK